MLFAVCTLSASFRPTLQAVVSCSTESPRAWPLPLSACAAPTVGLSAAFSYLISALKGFFCLFVLLMLVLVFFFLGMLVFDLCCDMRWLKYSAKYAVIYTRCRSCSASGS